MTFALSSRAVRARGCLRRLPFTPWHWQRGTASELKLFVVVLVDDLLAGRLLLRFRVLLGFRVGLDHDPLLRCAPLRAPLVRVLRNDVLRVQAEIAVDLVAEILLNGANILVIAIS